MSNNIQSWYSRLKAFFDSNEARKSPSKFKKYASKFIPEREVSDYSLKKKDFRRYIYSRNFNKPQLIGALIHNGKQIYRVVSSVLDDGQQELIRIK